MNRLPPASLHAVILWGSLPLVREDYRRSQFHRLCSQPSRSKC